MLEVPADPACPKLERVPPFWNFLEWADLPREPLIVADWLARIAAMPLHQETEEYARENCLRCEGKGERYCGECDDWRTCRYCDGNGEKKLTREINALPFSVRLAPDGSFVEPIESKNGPLGTTPPRFQARYLRDVAETLRDLGVAEARWSTVEVTPPGSDPRDGPYYHLRVGGTVVS